MTMRLLIFALMFTALVPVSALAGSITITIRNDANAVIGTPQVFNLTNAQMVRLLDTMRANYGKVPSGPADPVTGIVPMRDRTNAEATVAWLTGFWRGTLANVKSYEETVAAGAAKAAIVPIPE